MHRQLPGQDFHLLVKCAFTAHQHFRLLVESVQEYGVFMLSVDGRIESWNQGSQRLKGYRSYEAIGTNWSRFFPPEEVQRGTPKRLLDEAATKGHSSYEGWLVRKGGDRFWTVVTLSAVEDGHGRLLGLSNVARDLTERKQTEDALRESEERLRLLVDSLREYGVFMISREGVVTGWSPGAARLEGSKAEDVVGAPVSRFFPPGELEKGTPRRLLDQAAGEGRSDYEGWIVRGDGTTVWASITFSAVKDASGHLHGFSVVAQDLTARLRAERAQSLLSDASNLLAGSLDQRTTLDRVAHLATRDLARWCVVEMRQGDLLQPVAVAHVDPEREQRLRAGVQAIPAASRLSHGVASVVQTERPELKEVVPDPGWIAEALGLDQVELVRDLGAQSYMCVPLTARGKTIGAIGLVAAPGRHYVRDDLLLAQELARRAALAIDNARLYEQAQAAVRMREEVLAVVSHDLRSPLTTIGLWAAQLLAKAGDAHERKTTIVLAERIRRASDRMARMIGDLLDFSSIQSGRLSIQPQLHPVDALVRDAVEVLQPIAVEKNVRLETDAEPASGLEVRCDRERILQVLSNLVGNAIKFTGPGGAVTVRLRRERGFLVFIIRDTGPGIEKEHLPHVFERYWKSSVNSPDSLGLGLAISRAIVESHGGTIQVESPPGQGATFSFSLPLAEPPAR